MRNGKKGWKPLVSTLRASEGDLSALAGFLKIHVDKATNARWVAMEDNGKNMTYDELWKGLEFTYGMNKEVFEWKRWDELRLEYPVANHTRAAWEPFLASFEALARASGVSESDKLRNLMSMVSPSLGRVLGEAQVQKYKVVVSSVTMRRAQRVPMSASQVRVLVGEAGRP